MPDIDTITPERWLPVTDFDDYQVSSFGRIRSITPRKGSRAICKPYLSGWVQWHKNGYPVKVVVALCKDGKKKEFALHKLVLTAFVGPAPDGTECCHNDGDPLNNRLTNLRWDTHRENIADCIRHKRKSNPPIHCGENHPRAKLTAANVAIIRSALFHRGTLTQLAELFGVSTMTIHRVRKGDAWKG